MIKILVFLSLLPCFNTLPQRLYERIFYPDVNGGSFGYYVILTDTLIFISSPHDDIYGWSSGSVYYYHKVGSNWTFKNRIIPPDGNQWDLFGVLHLYDKYLYVGAPGNLGAVYVYKFENNDWVKIQKIIPDSLTYLSPIGSSIQQFDDYLAVGAENDSRFAEYSGAVYIYKKETNGFWKVSQKIYPRVLKEFAHFGYKLTYNKFHKHLIVSAPEDSNETGRFAGNVYIYQKSDSLWEIKQILSPDIGEEWPYFGSSLATKEDYLFVGASGSGSTQSGGCVYVYKIKNGFWEFVRKISSPINIRRDYFGYSIYIEGDSLLVGAPGERYYGVRISRAYLYSQNEDDFNLEYIFEPSDTNYNYSDGFGIDVCVNKGIFLIGAPEIRKAFLYSPYPVSVYDNEKLTDKFELYQNFPNPFNPSTKISWQSPVGGYTILKVYDILGREIATLIDGYREAGKYEVEFPDVETGHALSLQSGVYFYHLRIGNYTETKKMVLIR